jgi:hypothetical protein
MLVEMEHAQAADQMWTMVGGPAEDEAADEAASPHVEHVSQQSSEAASSSSSNVMDVTTFEELYAFATYVEGSIEENAIKNTLLGDEGAKLTFPFVKMAEAYLQTLVWEEVHAGCRSHMGHSSHRAKFDHQPESSAWNHQPSAISLQRWKK